MSKKAILITGFSANGLGASLTLAVAKSSPSQIHVFATARDTSKIPHALSSLDNVIVIPLDVKSPDSIADAVKAVASYPDTDGLDILVNNAATSYAMPFLDVDIDTAKGVFDTNFWGPLQMIQAFSDLMVARRGRVVNVSTIATFINAPWNGVYSSSKVALNQLSETLRLELGPFGVNVMTIVLGVMKTSFYAYDQAAGVLPEGLRYVVVQDKVAGWATGSRESVPPGSNMDEVAEKLVPAVLGPGGYVGQRKVWLGEKAAVMKWLVRWFPQWLIDYLVSERQGLDVLKKSLQLN